MTRRMVVGLALALSVLGATAVYAGYGCNGGPGMFGPNPDLEKVRTFQKETGSLRDEMMIKRLELSQELNKATPDKARVAELKREMVEIRTKLQDSAAKLGLTGGCLTECDQDPVDCAKGGCSKRGRHVHGGTMPGGCGNCNR